MSEKPDEKIVSGHKVYAHQGSKSAVSGHSLGMVIDFKPGTGRNRQLSIISHLGRNIGR